MAAWLSETAGRRVAVQHPVQGEKRRLVEMAIANAEDLLRREGAGRQESLGAQL